MIVLNQVEIKDIWDIEDAICPECHSLISTNRIDIETGEKYLVCDQCGYTIRLCSN